MLLQTLRTRAPLRVRHQVGRALCLAKFFSKCAQRGRNRGLGLLQQRRYIGPPGQARELWQPLPPPRTAGRSPAQEVFL